MENSFGEIFKYLKILYKRRFVFIFVALFVMSAITAGSYFLPKKYEADSTVFIEKNVINDLVKGIAVTPDMDNRVRVIKYALLSRNLISKVLADMDIDTKVKNTAELQDMVSDLQKRTDIKVKDKEGLFIVSITDQDPHFAQDYVNKLVRKYVEENLSGKREETYGANRFLDEQLIHFKDKLDQAEDTIIEFRRSKGVFLSVDEKSALDDIKEYQKEIESINLSINTLKAKRRSLKSQLQSVEPTVAIFSEKKEDRIIRLEEKIRQLLLTYTENYPEVVKLKAEIEGLKRRMENGSGDAAQTDMTSINPLHQDLQQKLFDVEAEMSALEGRRNMVHKLMGEREKELQDVPENRKKLAVLIQERDSYRKIYEQLLMRAGQSEVSKQMEIGDKATTFRIVDPALLPMVPVSPNMIKMILLAIAAGLGCGFGAVVLLDNLNSSVKEVQQLRNMGVEVLAVIPSMTDEVQVAQQKRKDLLVYTFAGLYFCGIIGLLAWEAMKRVA
jgi:polysaccharide chain length determinant protein (PEP-CTERM system associated)